MLSVVDSSKETRGNDKAISKVSRRDSCISSDRKYELMSPASVAITVIAASAVQLSRKRRRRWVRKLYERTAVERMLCRALFRHNRYSPMKWKPGIDLPTLGPSHLQFILPIFLHLVSFVSLQNHKYIDLFSWHYVYTRAPRHAHGKRNTDKTCYNIAGKWTFSFRPNLVASSDRSHIMVVS